MTRSRTRKILAVFSLAVVLGLGAAGSSIADGQYDDRDSNYMRVAGVVVRPLGVLTEWLVMRPIHAIGHLINGQDEELFVDQACGGQRPRRGCETVAD